jgi:hypothetical protein
MTATICCLLEGDYHIGLAALVNSLHRSGYRGDVYAGYRGPLPPWIDSFQTTPGEDDSVVVTYAPGCHIRFVRVTTTRHLTSFKARFLSRVWAELAPSADALFYFDPDIVVRCRWSFFEDWVTAGIALCADVNGMMASNHPLRAAWRRLLTPLGFAPTRALDSYFNAGFVGLDRGSADFLDLWDRVLNAISDAGGDLHVLHQPDRADPFAVPDQDGFNYALMVSGLPFSSVGPEGMDFEPGGFLMSHAIGQPKPWRKRFAWTALKGRRPSRADKAFFENVSGPIRPFGAVESAFRRTDFYLGSALGRYLG